MRTFYEFDSRQEAIDYRQQHGTGGWIFVAAMLGPVYIFPHDMTPTQIFNHPLTRERSGELIGCAGEVIQSHGVLLPANRPSDKAGLPDDIRLKGDILRSATNAPIVELTPVAPLEPSDMLGVPKPAAAETNRERWLATYTDVLMTIYGEEKEYLARLPSSLQRATPKESLRALAEHMTEGLPTHRSNKDSEAIRKTCRLLGINHSYKAIGDFLKCTASN